MSTIGWRDRLTGQMPEDLAEEIDIFETQVELRIDGRVDERVFAETRLRRGVYGQRYDNGQRHDGIDLVRPFRERIGGTDLEMNEIGNGHVSSSRQDLWTVRSSARLP